MRFFANKKQISFDEFKQLRPVEANALEKALELEADFELDQDNRLFLSSESAGVMSIELAKMMEYHRRFFHKNSVYQQPLAKALGVKRGVARPKVMDATAGTMKDSCLLLSMGLEVMACERSPLAQALILNALDACPLKDFSFFSQDAISFTLGSDFSRIDVIYFDPMYESPSKKAAPRKEMRIFRDLVEVDKDAKETAQLLKETGKRLVIKRPQKSPPLLEGPDISFGKKSTSYDVFLEKLQSKGV